MARFKFNGQEKIIDARIREESERSVRETEDARKYALTITAAASGNSSLSGLPVKTEAFKKWMISLNAKNPFIGKPYMQAAPEFSVESEEVKKPEEMSEDDAKKILDVDENNRAHIKDDFDPNGCDGADSIEDDEKTRKFKAMCAMTNVVSRMIGCDIDDIVDAVGTELDDLGLDFGADVTPTVQKLVDNEKVRLRLEDQSAKKRAEQEKIKNSPPADKL